MEAWTQRGSQETLFRWDSLHLSRQARALQRLSEEELAQGSEPCLNGGDGHGIAKRQMALAVWTRSPGW